MWSPLLKKYIAIARIPPRFAKLGSHFFIEEVIDPVSGNPVPYGEQGERVVTSFGRGMMIVADAPIRAAAWATPWA